MYVNVRPPPSQENPVPHRTIQLGAPSWSKIISNCFTNEILNLFQPSRTAYPCVSGYPFQKIANFLASRIQPNLFLSMYGYGEDEWKDEWNTRDKICVARTDQHILRYLEILFSVESSKICDPARFQKEKTTAVDPWPFSCTPFCSAQRENPQHQLMLRLISLATSPPETGGKPREKTPRCGHYYWWFRNLAITSWGW